MAHPNRSQKVRDVATAARISERQVEVGLDGALWEMGPNDLTDFADGLQFEGKPMTPLDSQEAWEARGRFRDALTLFLSGKNATLVGGVAVRSYGGRMEPTKDYDVLIDPALLKELTAFLESQGGVLDSNEEETYFFFMHGPQLHLDVSVAWNPLYREALSTAKKATFQGRELKIVLPAVLGAMKVKAYQERRDPKKKELDRSDVRGLLSVGAATEEEIRAVLKTHRPDLLAVLSEVLA